MAGGIAHDFNNILTSVLGFANLAMLDVQTGTPMRHYLDQIETAAQRASELCQQLLAYSGRGKFTTDALNVSEVGLEMLHMLQVSISKKAELIKDLPGGLPMILADGTQIRQIIMNLITNASDALGDATGTIGLRTGHTLRPPMMSRENFLPEQCPGGYVFIEVKDSGCGMDEQTRSKIFDPFFSTKFTGRGLGLAATLGIVRGHQGAIEMHSRPGQGTTFRIYFPAIATQLSRENQEKSEREWRGSGTILVVDDEAQVRSFIRTTLEMFGFKVIQANDGRQAIAVFEQTHAQLSAVLLDLTMPYLSGEETLEHLQAIDDSIPVIISSGYNESDVAQRFSAGRIAGFIQKPYRPTALLDKLRSVVESPHQS